MDSEPEHPTARAPSSWPWAWMALGVVVPSLTLVVLRSVFATFLAYHLVLGLGASVWTIRRRGAAVVLGERASARAALLAGGAVGLSLALATIVLFERVGEQLLDPARIGAALDAWSIRPEDTAWMVLFMVAGNGAAEELFWRGLVHGKMRRRAGRRATVLVVAAAYTGYHVVTLGALVAPVVATVLVLVVFTGGALFGWLRERTGHVLAPVLAHTGASVGYMAVYLRLAAAPTG